MTAFLGRARRYVPPLIPRELPPPYGPDPAVFGPDLSLQRTITAGYAGEYRYCRDCDIRWRGDEPCLNCGARAPELTL